MNKLNCKDSSLAYVFGFLLCQILVTIATVVASVICALNNIEVEVLEQFLKNPWGYLILVSTMNLGLFLVFLFYKKKSKVSIFSKPKPKKILIYIGIAILSFVMLYPIINVVDTWLIKRGVESSEFPYKLNTQGYLISIISLALIPAVFEELLFRGIIFNGLKPYGKTFSIVVSAVMFSVFHMSLNQTLYPVLMGLLFGGIMFKENNILYTMIVHFVCNFTTITLAYFNISFVFSGWVYVAIACILAVAFLTFALIYAIQGNKASKQIKISRNEVYYFAGCLIFMVGFWVITIVSELLWTIKIYLKSDLFILLQYF